MQPQILTGSRCIISISGQEVAAAFVADWSIDTSATEIETIDMVQPAEIAPDRIRISLGLRVYRTPDNDPVQMLQAPGDTGKEPQAAFVSAPYITVDIKDRNDKTVFSIPKAWLVRRSASMSAGDFLIESWSIKGIGYLGPTS